VSLPLGTLLYNTTRSQHISPHQCLLVPLRLTTLVVRQNLMWASSRGNGVEKDSGEVLPPKVIALRICHKKCIKFPGILLVICDHRALRVIALLAVLFETCRQTTSWIVTCASPEANPKQGCPGSSYCLAMTWVPTSRRQRHRHRTIRTSAEKAKTDDLMAVSQFDSGKPGEGLSKGRHQTDDEDIPLTSSCVMDAEPAAIQKRRLWEDLQPSL